MRTASRSTGGVAISDRSRTPVSAICRVRGMGVAVSVSICTSARRLFSRSLCTTPKCCSSSTITMPSREKEMFFASKACVPMTISTAPDAKPSLVVAADAVPTKRDNSAISTGNPAKRSRKVLACWRASRVVGATTATCLPDMAAIKAARKPTSVLPKPTSPQIRRSIGRPLPKSSITASMASSWSSVSSNGKRAANSS